MLIVNKLRVQAQLTETNKEDDEQSKRDPAPADADEQKRAKHREYVEHRLKEIRSWERRISGNKN